MDGCLRPLPPHSYKWIAVGVVALLVLGTLLASPATAGRAVKTTYHALPHPITAAVPDSVEQHVGRAVDAVTRFFTFGNPRQLIHLDLRLESASSPPGAWTASHQLKLRWTDLGEGVTYQVQGGHGPVNKNGVDVALGTFSRPEASLNLPGDGDWFIRVQAHAHGSTGRTTVFGPFRIDSTPAPPPVLDPILPPPGYSFSMTWSSVTDTSGILGYQVERLGTGTIFQPLTQTTQLSHQEEQLGNGHYAYRVRSINGAGSLSLPSNVQEVTIQAPMRNPGTGSFLYGIQANYTSFMKIWDLSDPSRFASIDKVPAGIAKDYLGGGWGFETANQTLVRKTHEIVGSERNTERIAEKLFVWLFDYADYDSCKLDAASGAATRAGCTSVSPGSVGKDCPPEGGGLQRAGCTYDLRKGICGDLATLYITMLRIAGVPARPVHGYLDNPGAGIGDFHVWVEVWVGWSLQSNDPSDTSQDWMTVDVSGISGPYEPDALMVYFGIFNPEYLALGLAADYLDPSWNAWAQFGWSTTPGAPNPEFMALGKPVELESKSMDLYFNPQTKKRTLVEHGKDPPAGYNMFFPDVKVVSKKRIDYGVNLNKTHPVPVNATIRVRYPVSDAFAAVLPWQSVIYTIYSNSPTVEKEPGKQYSRLDPLGFVIWEDHYRP